MNKSYTIRTGHTLKEYMSKFGSAYARGDLWDFPVYELENGAIEPQDNMTYWLIGGRLYETEE